GREYWMMNETTQELSIDFLKTGTAKARPLQRAFTRVREVLNSDQVVQNMIDYINNLLKNSESGKQNFLLDFSQWGERTINNIYLKSLYEAIFKLSKKGGVTLIGPLPVNLKGILERNVNLVESEKHKFFVK